MGALSLLLPVLVVAGIVYLARRRDPTDATVTVPTVVAGSLEAGLDRWVAAGLVTDAQRSSILDHERAAAIAVPAPPPLEVGARRVPAVAEALGYLGGMLAVVGLALILGQYWPDMATGARLALSGLATVALLGAGSLAPEQADPAFRRLRWSLWLAATASAALFAGVLSADGLGVANQTILLIGAATVAALSVGLWRGRVRPVQQLTALIGVVVAAGALVAEVATAGFIGLAVWFVGVALLGMGLLRRTSTPIMTEAVGVSALLVGATIMAAGWAAAGLLLVTGSALAVLVLATWVDLVPDHSSRVVLGVISGLCLVEAVPSTLGYFSRDAGGATGLATWAMGAVVLAVGARRLVRHPAAAEIVGGAALLGGAALTGVQWHGFAPIFGAGTALALVGLGMLPGQVLLSVLGSAGLLVNVPWTIGWFFPGEGRAPLLIMVSGGLIIAIAVLLTRMGGRFRGDLGALRRPPRGPQPGVSH